jgi:hypothetical protein
MSTDRKISGRGWSQGTFSSTEIKYNGFCRGELVLRQHMPSSKVHHI